jgi:hypothetical protein
MALPANQLSRVPPPEDPHHVAHGKSRSRRASRPHQNRAICTWRDTTRLQASAIISSADSCHHLLVMDWAIRSARSGSVAARAFTTLASASPFLMEWMIRSARSGSVAASAPAMLARARVFDSLSVMDWAMRSARSGSVAASASAMLARARAFGLYR